MVEAAIVLPILILMIVSIIYIGVFHFESLKVQCELQHSVANNILGDESLVKKIESSNGFSSYIPGMVSKVFSLEQSVYGYSLDEAMMVRTGKLVI